MTLALVRLCRPYYAVPMALTYTLTLYYARGGEMAGEGFGAAASTIALALVIAAAYVLNDVCDVAVDRSNAPERPLPAGHVSRRTAAVWGAIVAAAGLGAAWLARERFALGLAAVAAGLMLYNAFSKRLGPAKPLLVGVLMTCIYPLAIAQAGGVSGSRAAALAAFPVWMFLTVFGYEILKDIRDIPGDRANAARPMPVQLRPRLRRGIANAAIPVAGLVLVLPLFLGCRWVYGAMVSLAIAAAGVSVFLPIRAAIAMVYGECLIVGVAAAADALIFGF